MSDGKRTSGSKIFRKVALERLSSPEQLDQLLQVTSPTGWLALAAVGALLLVSILWGVYGSIPTEASGAGILLRRGGVSDLVATGEGQVEKLLVAVGDEIHRDQVVARVRQEPLIRQLDDARARLTRLESEYADLERYAEEQKRLQARNLEQERANLERSIQTLERDLAILSEKLEVEEALLTEGLITKQAQLETERRLNETRDQLATARLELNSLELTRLEAEQALDQQLETRRGAIRDLELEIRDKEATLEENANVLSPYDGRVLELMVDSGDVVTRGSQILSVEVTSEELMAVLFVPASSGKQVRPGMTARISPSTVKREEYGYMLGEVTWVSEFPATRRGMLRLLANEALVDSLVQEGPPIQVEVALAKDPSTPTGYRWSSSTGPSLTISSGTLAQGSVIVERQRPINLVIPRIRKELGI